MSDAPSTANALQGWSPDPLLSGRAQVPHFLRTQWDEASARSFGPWRVAGPVDPAAGQTADGLITDPAAAHPPADTAPTEAAEVPTDTAADGSDANASPWSESAIATLKKESWEEGRQAGLQQAREEHEAARHKEGEILRHLGIELRSLQQDPQRFFEPLKRLALHIAEQWVRGELQISGQAIEQLIRQCLDQLDPAGEKVHVDLNPADLERLQKLGEQATADLELQADPQLREGSVRVRLNESVVQDLIEHRVEAMARKLLQQPESWLQSSALLHPDKVTPLESPDVRRHWTQPTQDVQEAEIKEVQPPTDEEASP